MEKWKIHLLAILLLGFLLRFISIQYPNLHQWDEKYHALVAKNCTKHPFRPMLYDRPLLNYDYKNWTQNHIWLHKQPFPIWVMAGFLAAFGIDELILRLPSLILSLLSVYLTFLIGRHLYNEKVGLIASFLHSIHWLTIELVGGWIATDHYDVFFTALIELSVWFFLNHSRNRAYSTLVFASVALGLAILTKWLTAIFVLVIWLSHELLSRSDTRNYAQLIRASLMCILILFAVVLPWQIYTAHFFPNEYQWEANYNVIHMTEALEGHEHDWSFHIQYMGFHYGELVYLSILFVLFRIFNRTKIASDIPIFLWILIPYLFFTIAKTKMQAYTLIASPALFIATALLVKFLLQEYRNNKLKILAWLVGLGLILIPAFRILERGTYKLRKIYDTDVIDYASWNFTPSTVVFNYAHPVEAMFYQEALVYSKIPSENDVDKAFQKGYKVIVFDGQKIPASLRHREDITIKSNASDQLEE